MEGVCRRRSSSSFISSSLLLILLFLIYVSSYGVMASSNYKKGTKKVSTLQLERIQSYLQKINKTPVKSIKSPDGDIIDCVPIDKQPAFDNPLLKNHKIQRVPPMLWRLENERGPENYTASDAGASRQAWHQAGSCPRGTVAIRRTTVDDVLRAKSLYHFGKKQEKVPTARSVVAPDAATANFRQFAIVRTQGKLNGASASINVWKPNVEGASDFSLSQIWVASETSQESELDTVEAGWMVNPTLYGDKNPRVTIYWTRDNYNATGCYNLLCEGFIQTSNKIALGAALAPLSSYSGKQFHITLLISVGAGNWWLKYGDTKIGYWPAEWFDTLKNGATAVDWGGAVASMQSNGAHTATGMGSGHFAEEGFGKASYFRNLQIVDRDDNLIPLESFDTIVNNGNCYNLKSYKNEDWGTHFYYGGPGRSANCP